MSDSFEWGFSKATTSLIRAYWYTKVMYGEEAAEKLLQDRYDEHIAIIYKMKKHDQERLS